MVAHLDFTPLYVPMARALRAYLLKKRGERMEGLPVSEMSRDQQKLVEQVMSDLLLPFRKQDSDEAMRTLLSVDRVREGDFLGGAGSGPHRTHRGHPAPCPV